jgi:hypothetical protein
MIILMLEQLETKAEVNQDQILEAAMKTLEILVNF